MILRSLADYYDQLLRDHPQDIAHPGWCQRQVMCMLELSEDGELLNVIPSSEKRGWEKTVPEQIKRASGIAANLLCDNASYLLGFSEEEGKKAERVRRCFEKSKERHLSFLSGLHSAAAVAVRRFFETWDPSQAVESPPILAAKDQLYAGGNLVFRVGVQEVLDDPEIQEAWNRLYRQPAQDDVVMRCLVSGKRAAIARLHPAIKGVRGAQSMGASLVSFNARAFESYGHDEEQGLNAPVSEYAAFAYTTALNYLLSDKNHHMVLGDTTIVYWADRTDKACSKVYTDFLNPRPLNDSEKGSGQGEDADALISAVMSKLEKGLPFKPVDSKARFFVLGVAPSAARLSVRFFYYGPFDVMLGNLKHHYDRLDIIHPSFEREYLTPYQLIAETENPHAKQMAASSILGGALMRSILGDQPYPVALYENVLLRVHASRDVNRGKAAIIKAYLIQNNRQNTEREVVTVGLNTERKDEPYLLGRLFSRLEDLQYAVNPDLNTTIKDKYFNAASTTPAMVFPLLMRLGEQHASKLKRDKPGAATNFWREAREFNDFFQSYPKNLSPEEQGAFLLGYYHQSQQSFIDRKNAKEEREQKKAQSSSESQED